MPDLFAANADEVQNAPRRQIELRITAALRRKAEKFERYRENGIIGERDSCIVAISGAQFALEAAGAGLPHAVTAVYPFGEEFAVLDTETAEFVSFGHRYSEAIQSAVGPEPRTAFQHDDEFAGIAGLICRFDRLATFLAKVMILSMFTTRRPSGRFREAGSHGWPNILR